MRLLSCVFNLSLFALLLLSCAHNTTNNRAPKNSDHNLTAAETVSMMIYSLANKRVVLNASLQKVREETIPLKLQIGKNLILFTFVHQNGGVGIRIDDEGFINPVVNSENNLLGKTDAHIADLSFQYLYWPDAEFLEESRCLGNRKCHKIQVINPNQDIDPVENPYNSVIVWIDKMTGAMVKVESFIGIDDEQEKVKELSVTHGKPIYVFRNNKGVLLSEETIEALTKEEKKRYQIWIPTSVRIVKYVNGRRINPSTWIRISEIK